MHGGEARHLGARDTRFGIDEAALDTGAQSRRVHEDDRAAPTAVAYQQVRAEADDEQRLARRGLAQESTQVVQVCRYVEAIGPAAGAPGHVPAHGLVRLELPAKILEVHRLGHVHASCAGTLPMEPAPMVSTTSPARATRRMASGISPMSSTNTGSTLPATRTARASDRPSAATMGGSPAG